MLLRSALQVTNIGTETIRRHMDGIYINLFQKACSQICDVTRYKYSITNAHPVGGCPQLDTWHELTAGHNGAIHRLVLRAIWTVHWRKKNRVACSVSCVSFSLFCY